MQIITSFTGYNATHASTLCVKCMEILKYSGSSLNWSGPCVNCCGDQLSRLSVWVEQSSANTRQEFRPCASTEATLQAWFLFSKASLPGIGGISILVACTHRDVFVLTVWISPTFLVSLRPLMDRGEFTLQETEMLLNVIHCCVWHGRHFILFSKLVWRTGWLCSTLARTSPLELLN